MKFGITGLVIFALLAVAEARQIRASFEAGDFSGWTQQGKGWSIYSKAASDGSKSAMYTVAKKEQPGLYACAKVVGETDPGWVVSAQVDVTGKAKYKSSKVNLALMCIDAEGNTIRESKKTVSTPYPDFNTVELEEIVVPSGTAEVYFMIVVEVIQPARAKEWWRFDNIIINVE